MGEGFPSSYQDFWQIAAQDAVLIMFMHFFCPSCRRMVAGMKCLFSAEIGMEVPSLMALEHLQGTFAVDSAHSCHHVSSMLKARHSSNLECGLIGW